MNLILAQLCIWAWFQSKILRWVYQWRSIFSKISFMNLLFYALCLTLLWPHRFDFYSQLKKNRVHQKKYRQSKQKILGHKAIWIRLKIKIEIREKNSLNRNLREHKWFWKNMGMRSVLRCTNFQRCIIYVQLKSYPSIFRLLSLT